MLMVVVGAAAAPGLRTNPGDATAAAAPGGLAAAGAVAARAAIEPREGRDRGFKAHIEALGAQLGRRALIAGQHCTPLDCLLWATMGLCGVQLLKFDDHPDIMWLHS
jgi:hypothetical protein